LHFSKDTQARFRHYMEKELPKYSLEKNAAITKPTKIKIKLFYTLSYKLYYWSNFIFDLLYFEEIELNHDISSMV